MDRTKLSMLPQNPQALFTEITVEEELLEALYYIKIPDSAKIDQVKSMLALMEIEHLRKANPYDLSGGEQQRLALGKNFAAEAKNFAAGRADQGVGPFFKRTLAGILRKLVENDVTIFYGFPRHRILRRVCRSMCNVF